MLDIFALDGAAKKVDKIERGNKLWVDVTDPKNGELDFLKDFGVHPLTIEDCSKTTGRPKLEEFENYLYIILHGVRKEKFGFVQLNFILGKDFVISIHRNHPAFAELKNNMNKLTHIMKNGMDMLLHYLTDTEIDNYFPVLEFVESEIDKLEDRVFKEHNPHLVSRIFHLKRRLLNIRKHITPQRDVIGQILKRDLPFIKRGSIAYYRDIYDHISRINESAENYREILSNILEVHLSVGTHRMNEIMKVLTVMATIMLPLTLITSIYGMNLRIPESNYDFAYYGVLASMLLIGSGMLYYFRKKGWM